MGSKTSIFEEACVMLIPISSRPIAYTTYQVPNTICLIPTTYLQNRYICSTTYKDWTLLLSYVFICSPTICIYIYCCIAHTVQWVHTHTSKYLKWLHDAIHYLAFVVALHVYIHLFWPWIMVHNNDLSFGRLVIAFG